MLTLGVDLCLPTGSVAVGSKEGVLAVFFWSEPKIHAERVFFAIDRCLEIAGRSREDIKRVVVTSGPGSFTGVRLSVTLGKAFKVCGKEVFSVPTLKAMKLYYERFGKDVVPVIEARKGRFYALVGDKYLDVGGGELSEVLDSLGDPFVVYRGFLDQRIRGRFRCVEDAVPLALILLLLPGGSFGELGFCYVREHDAKPVYGR